MPFKPVTGQVSLYKMQEEILSFWLEKGIFQKSVEFRPENQQYTFYDGPPFITGIPHYATLLPSIAKDIMPRYQTMKGKRVRRVWGWDCHGLPAETKVEQKLGIRSKREIEEMGIDKFIAACREYVSEVSSEWRWYVDHIGRWADMDNAYRTMDLPFMESVVWTFRQLYDQGLIYEGMRTSLYCPRCATPLSKFEITMDDGFYREVEDPAVTIKFKLVGEERYVLAWTTTPWTLPSNRALAVDVNSTYVEAVALDGEKVILAESAYERYGDSLREITSKIQGKELVGLAYEPLYPWGPKTGADYHVYAADFVNMEDGTGIVHVAPAYGEDDFKLGQQHGLSIFVSLNEEGKFTDEVPVYAGQYYKKTNTPIMAELEGRQLLLRQSTVRHAYPHCYRCETPLIYKAQTAWYFKVDNLREKLKETNRGINWMPEHFGSGRFVYNLENAPDWCISRSRYWGTPLPVWKCSACGQATVPGSLAEIKELSGQTVTDLHRPLIDEVKWPCKCGGEMRRIPEILDVWFESGAMPYAQFHYPFENKEEFEASNPADFIIEYTGQLRGWFYYLHVLANALWQGPAFKNVVVTGVIKGNDGRKMSKSFGNYPDPKQIIQKYGGEALRLYFMSNPIMHGEDMNVTEEDITEHYRKTMMLIWNSYRYFLTYAELHNFVPSEEESDNILDVWIRGQLERLVVEIESGLEKMDYVRAVRAIRPFVDDLSTWYIRRSRTRFVRGDKQALETMYAVLTRFAQATAPILPFTAESIYQNLVAGQNADMPESVHLTDWAPANQDLIAATEEGRARMDLVRQVCFLGHSLRKEAGANLRQALAEVRVSQKDGVKLGQAYQQMIAEELNVKSVGDMPGQVTEEGWGQREEGGVAVALDLRITPELQADGWMREIIRHGQMLRKQAGCKLGEKVRLVVFSENDMLRAAITNQREVIMQALQADVIEEQLGSEGVSQDVELAPGMSVHLGIQRKD